MPRKCLLTPSRRMSFAAEAGAFTTPADPDTKVGRIAFNNRTPLFYRSTRLSRLYANAGPKCLQDTLDRCSFRRNLDDLLCRRRSLYFHHDSDRQKEYKGKNVCGFITHSYEVMPLAVDPCLFANPYKCRHVCNGEPTANFWQQATCLMVLRQMPVRPALLRPIHASQTRLIRCRTLP